MKFIQYSLLLAIIVFYALSCTAFSNAQKKAQSVSGPTSISDSENSGPKNKKTDSHDETFATCAGNPEEESKPCVKLYLNDLDKIATSARVYGAKNEQVGQKISHVKLLPGRTTLAITKDESGGGIEIELLDQNGNAIPNANTKISSQVLADHGSATVFDKHVHKLDESRLGFRAGNIEDLDAATIERVRALDNQNFRAVAPRSKKENLNGVEYVLSTFRYDGLISYDIPLLSVGSPINQATINKDGTIFGTAAQRLYKIAVDGSVTETPQDLGLNWYSGITYDSRRDRLVVSTSHVYSNLAAYDLTTNKWSRIYEARTEEIRAVTYMHEFDALFYLGRSSRDGPYTMVGVDPITGAKKYGVRLPSSFPVTGYHAEEVVSFGQIGDFVAIIVSNVARYSGSSGVDANAPLPDLSKDLVIYLVDPITQRIVKTKSGLWELEYERPASKLTNWCENRDSNYVNPARSSSTTLAAIISVYEAGIIEVRVPHVNKPWDILLTSQEGVNWKIVPAAGAKIERLQIYSNETSTVDGVPKGTTVVKSSQQEDQGNQLSYIGRWEPNSSGASSYRKSIGIARKLLGVDATGDRVFSSCYRVTAPIDLGYLIEP